MNAFLLDRALFDLQLRYSCLPDVSGARWGPEAVGLLTDTLPSHDGCRCVGRALSRTQVQESDDREMVSVFLRSGEAFEWGQMWARYWPGPPLLPEGPRLQARFGWSVLSSIPPLRCGTRSLTEVGFGHPARLPARRAR